MSLENWVSEKIKCSQITPLAGDASFRRYFRINSDDKTYIAVDSPPDSEDNKAFIEVASRLQSVNLCVPTIHAYHEEKGYFLLEDLGDAVFYHTLNPDNFFQWYQLALNKLVLVQQASTKGMADFSDQLLKQELLFFREWFLEKHLQMSLTLAEQHLLNDLFILLHENAKQQPTVFIHRDYHSRNLLIVGEDVGIIDFQDAMIGPMTYDIASLLRDCYVAWPDELVNELIERFRWQLNIAVSKAQWKRWLDRMGVQRHLKAIFIFARKFHRDQNASYLPDIHRGLAYVDAVARDDKALWPFYQFLKNEIYPRWERLST